VGAKVYGRIIDNVVRLGEKVREHGVNVRINVNCIVGKWNYRYIGPMIALAQRLGNIGTISFGNFHPVGDAGTLRPLYKGDQEVVEYLGSMIARTDYELNIVLPSLCGRRTRFVCEMLFDTVLVGCTGDFSPCCHISTSPEWGNLYTDIEGYRHGALKSFRDRFSAARTYEDLPEPCRECPRLTRHQCRFDASRRTWVGTEFIE
jgi:MoaA/NifB/PqqE/SkfB family radical SAM enzyme